VTHTFWFLRILALLALWFSLVYGVRASGRVFKSRAQRIREAWAKAVGPTGRPSSRAHLLSACRQVYQAEPGASILFVILGLAIILFAFARFLVPHAVTR
jgi:hypothetical protein